MSRPDPGAPAPVPDEPVFDEPWQAEAFAIAVALQDRGWLDRAGFAEALGARLAGGAAYWDAWLAALEALVTDRGLTDPGSLDERAAVWQRAATATPHGSPVTLDADPQRS